MVDLFYAGYERGMSRTRFQLVLADVKTVTRYLWT
jgi:hypothetical protein